MRKAFKVATVFTGAAACAAMGAPAAEAATAANARQAEPATSVRNCAIGPRTTSMVFWWPNAANHGPTCLGGFANRGVSVDLEGNKFRAFCGGNNYGTIYTNPNAKWVVSGVTYKGYIPTHPGTGLYGLGSTSVEYVNIRSWSGQAKNTCATT